MKGLDLNSRIGKTYKPIHHVIVAAMNCSPGKLCKPAGFFEMLEQCTICKKIL